MAMRYFDIFSRFLPLAFAFSTNSLIANMDAFLHISSISVPAIPSVSAANKSISQLVSNALFFV